MGVDHTYGWESQPLSTEYLDAVIDYEFVIPRPEHCGTRLSANRCMMSWNSQ